MATINIVMKYGSVKGESTLQGREDWVVIDQISHGGQWMQTSQLGTTQDPTESTLTMEQITLHRTWDSSSFALFQAFANGQPESMVQISVVAGEGGKNTVAEYQLVNCSIGEWNMEHHGTGSATEVLTLTAAQMIVTGYGYDDKGVQDKAKRVPYNYMRASSS